MSKLIIVCGLAGSGKTTLAEKLSKKLCLACFHKDCLKENLYDLFDGNNLEDSAQMGRRSVSLMFKLIEEQISCGVDLIIEAPFNFSEDYELFSQWGKKYELDIYSVICSIDKDIRKNRFETRERHKSHHDQDRKVSFNDKYDYTDIPGKQIRVTTDRPVEEIVENIIFEINSK